MSSMMLLVSFCFVLIKLVESDLCESAHLIGTNCFSACINLNLTENG